MFRNSNVSISNPKLASISISTRSATLARSIIMLISHPHSIMVSLRFLPDTIVTGPLISVSFCRVKFRMRHCIKVLFPTFGGPITTTTIGGGLQWSSINHWNMMLFCLQILSPVKGSSHPHSRLNCKSFGISLPGIFFIS